jgi:hypothetical protein
MNSDNLIGFKQEMDKLGGDLAEAAKGVTLGALIGAGMSAVSTEILKKLIVNNQHLAIIAGAMMGGSLMGSSSYLISKLKGKPPQRAPTMPGMPPAGVPYSDVRTMP